MKQIILIVLLLLGVGVYINSQQLKKNKMKVAVWDTYVTKKDGTVMHFDVIAPEDIKDAETIYKYGHTYLKMKGQEGQSLTSKECRFCHIETVKPHMEEAINKNGYFIYEMENCN